MADEKKDDHKDDSSPIFDALIVAPIMFVIHAVEAVFSGGHGSSSGWHKGHGGPSRLDGFVHESVLTDFLFWIADWGISRGLVLWIFFLALIFTLSQEVPDLPAFFAAWFIGIMPIWLPIVLLIAAWETWVHYIHSLHIFHMQPVLLEVRIPREITKSPRAMELVFNNFRVTSGEVTFLSRAWHGKERTWYSFEIASFGGEIHFYVWGDKKYQRLTEANIYAQYPEVEIVEVEDYMSKFHFDPKVYQCFGQDFIYFKHWPYPTDEYPVKSYIDLELDKDPKEEYRIEPLAQIFETLSTLKPYEQAWIQILFRTDNKREGPLIPHKSNWKKRVEKQVDQIKKESALNPVYKHLPDTPENQKLRYYNAPRPTWRQQRTIETLERHMGKIAFEVGMRFVYISSGKFDGNMITALRYLWKPFTNPSYLNWLRPKHDHGDFDYPWQDYRDIRWNLITRRIIDKMRRRSYFYVPYETEGMVMTAETLATLYHYPSSTVKSPGLRRIPAKKAEPPTNLPK